MKRLFILPILIFLSINLFPQGQEAKPESQDVQALYTKINEMQKTIDDLKLVIEDTNFEESIDYYKGISSDIDKKFNRSMMGLSILIPFSIILFGGFSFFDSRKKKIQLDGITKEQENIRADIVRLSRLFKIEKIVLDSQKKAEESAKQSKSSELFVEALNLANQKKYEEAVAIYKKILNLFPDNAEAFNNLGSSYTSLKRYMQAKESFISAIMLRPEYSDAHYNLGIIYRILDETTKAIDSYKKAIEHDSNHFDAYINLGNIYLEINNPSEAFHYYSTATKISPDDPIGYFHLARFYSKQKEVDRAIENLRTSLEKGYNRPRKYIEDNEDFNIIEEDPRFQILLDKFFPDTTQPCKH